MLQTRTVEPRTLEILKELMKIELLQNFYLVGGTALALQLGHRFSIDLDLFTVEPFENERIISLLNPRFTCQIEVDAPNMLMVFIEQVKVDFIKMGYAVGYDPLDIEGVRMLDIKDIAPMKLKAIVQRGSRKDFYDLYYLMQILPLQDILDLFKAKFNQQEIFHVIKSLTYFDDAEKTLEPVVFDKLLTWDSVKLSVIDKVKAL